MGALDQVRSRLQAVRVAGGTAAVFAELGWAIVERLDALVKSADAQVNIGRDLRTLQVDMITTSRFRRGGYDGPFLRGVWYTLRVGEMIEIFSGHGEPAALMMEVVGPGFAQDIFYITDDTGSPTGGWRFSAAQDLSVANGNPIRLIADQHQSLFGYIDHGFAGETELRIRVYEAKL